MPQTRTRRLRWAGGLTAALTAAVLSATAPPAQAAPEGRTAGAGGPGAVGGSYLVTLAAGTDAASAAGRSVAEQYGARISQTYRTALNGYAVRTDPAGARRLAADDRVASVVQDTSVALGHHQGHPPSWGLDRIDRPSLPLDHGYSSPDAGGAGVTTYVIDTGVRITHRDFGGRARYGWDFVDGDRTAGDGNGHGTHVAGTIAGTTYGVAKKSAVVAVRVLDDDGAGTTAHVIAGIDWVTRHARRPAVANLSLGGPANAQLDAAVRNSIASGVTYVVAAGNGGLSASLFSPARVGQAITVGATGRTDTRADFSNFGSRLDLFAPGVAITSASHRSDTGSATLSGTSMATPHVTGVAVLYLAGHPRAAPARVGRALVRRASAGKVTDAGPGSPNELLLSGHP